MLRKLLATTLILASSVAYGDEPKYDLESPIKTSKNAQGEITALFTPVCRYELPDGKGGKYTLDFVGAVHIGDTAYYQLLNLHFQNYDKVLYELVAPDNQLTPPKDKNGGMMAQAAKMLLHLDHQLAVIDYDAKNFVHADWTQSEMKETLAENGDTPVTVMLAGILDMMRKQNKMQFEIEKAAKENREPDPEIVPPALLKQMEGETQLDIDVLALMLGDKNQSVKIKRLMAGQFETAGDMSFGPTVDGYIIGARNDDALGVLDKQVEAGTRTMALFYGAAHLPDFNEKLAKRGWKYQGTRWIPAWNDLEIQTANDTQDVNNLLRELQKFGK